MCSIFTNSGILLELPKNTGGSIMADVIEQEILEEGVEQYGTFANAGVSTLLSDELIEAVENTEYRSEEDQIAESKAGQTFEVENQTPVRITNHDARDTGSLPSHSKKNNKQKNPPVQKNVDEDDGVISVEIHSSCTFDTRFLNYKEIEDLKSKLKNLGCHSVRQNESSIVIVMPTGVAGLSIDEYKEELIEAYIESALSSDAVPPNEDNPRKYLREGVVFDDAFEARVDSEKLSQDGTAHWGVFGLSDVFNLRNADGSYRFPMSSSLVHYHDFLGSRKGAISHDAPFRPAIGLSRVTRPLHYPKSNFMMYLVNDASVITYRLRSVIEKAEGVFVPYYYIRRCNISRNRTTGEVTIVTKKEIVEGTDLISLILDHNPRYRSNTNLMEDLQKIGKEDLGIEISIPKPKRKEGGFNKK